MLTLPEILAYCARYNASDVHIIADVPPYIRLHGRLQPIPRTQPLTPADTKSLIYSILNEEQKTLFTQQLELDFSYSLPSGHRFRVNIYHEKGHPAGAFRLIPAQIKTLSQLNLPPILEELTQLHQGFILVTGPTGHGKSTTLAAMIEIINQTQAQNIITIEDPIEFVYTPKKSIISQRELHADTQSWHAALRSVLREDPNVVLIGEMRDHETIASALTIAETGHLVFATLHTNNAAQTINRIVDVFPHQQQQQIRTQLADTLAAVISQRLLPATDGTRTPILEILLGNPAVSNIIREGKTHLIPNIIQTSSELGMITFDAALAKSYKTGKITLQTAKEYAQNPEEFDRLINTQ